MTWRKCWAALGAGCAVIMMTAATSVFAQSSSANYKVEESYFGAGGELDASSGNYRARQSAGDLVVGRSSSGNYQFQGGFNTSDVPLLEFALDGGAYDLGILDYGNTNSLTASFTVRNYLSSGYIIRMNGTVPVLSDGTHALTSMNVLASSQPGVEQFGVNVVNNSVPDVGADPVQQPDSSFSYGTAVSGYDTANMFKFVDGDTIAMSPRSSGQTTYALSIIANVARETPAGQYGGHVSLQVIPTF